LARLVRARSHTVISPPTNDETERLLIRVGYSSKAASTDSLATLARILSATADVTAFVGPQVRTGDRRREHFRIP